MKIVGCEIVYRDSGNVSRGLNNTIREGCHNGRQILYADEPVNQRLCIG